MTSCSWLLFVLPFIIRASAEQCEADSGAEAADASLGQALMQRNIATRVVHNKIADDLPLAMEATEVRAAEQRMEAIEKLRIAVVKQGGATAEQLQNLFDFATDILPLQVTRESNGSNGLLQSNETDEANGSQPFEGDNDPLKARDKYDADYVRDGNGSSSYVLRDVPGKETLSVDIPAGDTVVKKHVLATYVVVPIALVLLVMFTLSNVMEKYEITAIPESGIMIIFGVILGLLLEKYAHFSFFDDAEAFSEMNSAILNLILLPIIIFASGWSIRRLDFYSQFPYIVCFAIGGIALSTLVIACLIRWTASLGLHAVTRWRTAFAYASLISATDPVATLATYAKLKVDPLLNILVFGESVINDAVAITLFNVFNSDGYMINEKGEDMQGVDLGASITWGVLSVFCGSTLIGIILGILYTFISHWADMKTNKKGQILVIFASCYLTYALAEGLGMSGIIAEMFAALIMGVYMRSHLSTEGSMLATFFVKQLAMLADALLCLLIGVSVVQLTTKGLYFGLWAMLFCMIGRCASVFPVGICVNILKEASGRANGITHEAGWNLLTPQHMFMMWHAGLRGAIALALSLELGKWVDEIDGAGTRTALQTATFFLICTFLLVFGGSTTACLRMLKIPNGSNQPADYLSKTENHGHLCALLSWLDRAVLAPLLIGKRANNPVTPVSEEEQDIEERLKSFHYS